MENEQEDPHWLDLTPFMVSDEERASNEDIYRKGCDDRCQLCGRPINPQSKSTGWIHLPTGVEAWPRGEDLPEWIDDMGVYPVGPKCKKKLPKEYIQ